MTIFDMLIISSFIHTYCAFSSLILNCVRLSGQVTIIPRLIAKSPLVALVISAFFLFFTTQFSFTLIYKTQFQTWYKDTSPFKWNHDEETLSAGERSSHLVVQRDSWATLTVREINGRLSTATCEAAERNKWVKSWNAEPADTIIIFISPECHSTFNH